MCVDVDFDRVENNKSIFLCLAGFYIFFFSRSFFFLFLILLFAVVFSASRAQPASLGLFRREWFIYMKSESFARACCFHMFTSFPTRLVIESVRRSRALAADAALDNELRLYRERETRRPNAQYRHIDERDRNRRRALHSSNRGTRI